MQEYLHDRHKRHRVHGHPFAEHFERELSETVQVEEQVSRTSLRLISDQLQSRDKGYCNVSTAGLINNTQESDSTAR